MRAFWMQQFKLMLQPNDDAFALPSPEIELQTAKNIKNKRCAYYSVACKYGDTRCAYVLFLCLGRAIL